ncbi:MAG: uncharacterized protein A8A55_2631 [Amphiamblys sp. WSBS2006]|nr:MAG: uncharacterized protein A8A55_2631 [Amphiamblys sp. WSBS2006]
MLWRCVFQTTFLCFVKTSDKKLDPIESLNQPDTGTLPTADTPQQTPRGETSKTERSRICLGGCTLASTYSGDVYSTAADKITLLSGTGRFPMFPLPDSSPRTADYRCVARADHPTARETQINILRVLKKRGTLTVSL